MVYLPSHAGNVRQDFSSRACVFYHAQGKGTRLILRVISPGHSGYPLENSRGRVSILGQLVSQGLLEFKQKAVARASVSTQSTQS